MLYIPHHRCAALCFSCHYIFSVGPTKKERQNLPIDSVQPIRIGAQNKSQKETKQKKIGKRKDEEAHKIQCFKNTLRTCSLCIQYIQRL